MTAPSALKKLVSFDGGETGAFQTFFPDRYKVLEDVFSSDTGTYSVRGAGLSYPGLSFGKDCGVIDLAQWRKILAFDQSTGTIEVEAGLSLGELAHFALDHSLYLKVQPGHPSISIGGCLGSDVHGKNQKTDGNFRQQVRFLKLFHPDHGFLTCSRSENADLFDLTCGGWGLTGVVVSVGLQLEKIPAYQVVSDTFLVEDFKALPALLEKLSPHYDLLYTWHDSTNLKSWGSGFVKAAKFAASSTERVDKSALNWKKLKAETRGNALALNLMNSLSVRCINTAYKIMEMKEGQKQEAFVDFLFPVAAKTFYFDLFGKAGFHETQVLFSPESFQEGMQALKSGIQKYGVPATVLSGKIFAGEQSLLRYDGKGIVMAINFPRNEKSTEFLKYWDDVVTSIGALPSLVKDSRLTATVAKKCYRDFEKFKTSLHAWDPKRRFKNNLSQRLEL